MKCKKHGELKNDEFYIQKTDGKWEIKRCRLCNRESAAKSKKRRRKEVNAWNREDRKRNPEIYRKHRKTYELKHPGKKSAQTICYRRGISLDEYQEMFIVQENKCAICFKVETRKRNGKVLRLTLDHNNVTGKNRQLLCHACNVGIGHLKESPELINEAVKYINFHIENKNNYIPKKLEINMKGIKKGHCKMHGKILSDNMTISRHNGIIRFVCKVCHRDRHKISSFNRTIAKLFPEKKISISREMYYAMEKEQNGLCNICKKPESRKINKKNELSKLCIDHDKKDGSIRSLLCTFCNAAIGYFNDSVTTLESAISYLRRH